MASEYGWPLISTGEILREAVGRNTPLGIEAKRQMDGGLLVADPVMIGLVKERTEAPDAAAGYVLDGFPRTVPQAEAWDALLAERGHALDAVVSLTAPDEELVKRLTERRECPVCKRAYNVTSARPRDGVHCDDDPTVVLGQRADDAEPTIRKRLEVYVVQTEPLVSHYRKQGRLVEVVGIGEMDSVHESVKRALLSVRAAK